MDKGVIAEEGTPEDIFVHPKEERYKRVPFTYFKCLGSIADWDRELRCLPQFFLRLLVKGKFQKILES